MRKTETGNGNGNKKPPAAKAAGGFLFYSNEFMHPMNIGRFVFLSMMA